ncbi:unnamed protein product [Allacma fusca]|uniref:Uncharacterized protein n=1 Tax=Allacma fusca TaxID=39272 RepID=A0A8J2PJE6_9HEXA|nr:unnamed protein product [Allacma fusca]
MKEPIQEPPNTGCVGGTLFTLGVKDLFLQALLSDRLFDERRRPFPVVSKQHTQSPKSPLPSGRAPLQCPAMYLCNYVGSSYLGMGVHMGHAMIGTGEIINVWYSVKDQRRLYEDGYILNMTTTDCFFFTCFGFDRSPQQTQ